MYHTCIHVHVHVHMYVHIVDETIEYGLDTVHWNPSIHQMRIPPLIRTLNINPKGVRIEGMFHCMDSASERGTKVITHQVCRGEMNSKSP